MITIQVNVDGVVHKMDTLAERARDLDRPLKRFGAYLRKRAIERYKAQDFTPLAESTLRARAQEGLNSLERKLEKDVRKAEKRSRPQAKPSFLQRALGIASPAILGPASRGVRNRESVLSEFRRRHRRGSEGLKGSAGGKALSVKQLASLDRREEKAVTKAMNAPILGGLPGTLVVEVQRGTVTLVSRTREHWTDVHNKGGTAGHGAKIPKRETIKLEQQDLAVLKQILEGWLVEPLQSV